MTEPTTPLRFVTATSLFDGHDAAINVMRRIMQREGAEVIHLGHNRPVHEIVDAAIQEDVHGVAVSSYQGGHVEFFKYMIDLLRERGAGHVRVFAGGGGVIVPAEAAELEAYGVEKIYTPEDGQKLGLVGMIRHMLEHADGRPAIAWEVELERLPRGGNGAGDGAAAEGGSGAPARSHTALARSHMALARSHMALARCLTCVELAEAGLANEEAAQYFQARVATLAGEHGAPVLGITGTGGAGKSSLTDEVIRRFLEEFPDKAVAVLSVDPTHRRTGGALLGDRIRMNAITTPRVFMRSIATRQPHLALPRGIPHAVALCRAAGYDLVIVETAGIGQSETEIADLADFSLYVMTPEFGAASQLEKIGMLDYADLIAINKFEKRGAADALRDVKKQVRRNRNWFDVADEALPVYGTVASRFQDPATDRFYDALIARMSEALKLDWRAGNGTASAASGTASAARGTASAARGTASAARGTASAARGTASAASGKAATQAAEPERPPVVIVPPERERYLSEVAESVRGYKAMVEAQAAHASRAYALRGALAALAAPAGAPLPDGPEPVDTAALGDDATAGALAEAYHRELEALSPEARERLSGFEALRRAHADEKYRYAVRGREIEVENYTETLAHTRMPKVVLPKARDWGDRLRWSMLENAPGGFPFTAGLFPFKRAEEEPTRMFAGEGSPERTNRRFHFVSAGQPAIRLSTAFDSVTLYGDDPHPRPDIYGKVGNSGVSICTVDDMKRLYSGFDLCAPNTSVSMTINGPAPVILAFFLNTAIDQQVEKHLRAEGRWEAARAQAEARFRERGVAPPAYREALPPHHDGLGLGLLGLTGEHVLPPETYAKLKADALRVVRGTVQADILKEDQAQNTCIFSTDFALTMMGDIQAYFVEHDMANFYSVSVSGYHMAEAGANPITQVAFTLANGFTYVENYMARGLPIDAFARNLSFFFSNGMDPEYAVIGRVARRIWAVALREKYGAGERAQKLKYHIQTSGRSLHAQEIGFNDIRTTLQALYAVYDYCNSLHTNAYDEAITTPTEESVRRAIAIQLVINREFGLAKAVNPMQGSYLIEELTDLVEEAILGEFDRLTERGGVLGAMETMYQRGKIQDESLYYEELKHTGAYPIVGVNTFLPETEPEPLPPGSLTRSTEEEKQAQIAGLDAFKALHAQEREAALAALKQTARQGDNLFAALMECVKTCSLAEISGALYQVGGQYRRNM